MPSLPSSSDSHTAPAPRASSVTHEARTTAIDEPEALRVELDRLNERLHVLESASLSARAYIETWLLLVVGGVAGKLLVDTIRDPEAEGVAWHVLPFAIVSLLVLVDIVRLRRKLGSVRTKENADLARQRELRTLLGLDEVQLPLDGPAAGPEAWDSVEFPSRASVTGATGAST